MAAMRAALRLLPDHSALLRSTACARAVLVHIHSSIPLDVEQNAGPLSARIAAAGGCV